MYKESSNTNRKLGRGQCTQLETFAISVIVNYLLAKYMQYI